MPSLYQTISTQKTKDGKNIFSQIYYPTVGLSEDDIYIITSTQDRYDLIAYDFWGDESLWRLIPMVNNLECDSMFPPIGIQLRIPSNQENILNLFKKYNEL